ncbi:MAG: class I SAM-dependent methyltransferase [Candidatus Dadabacteria bacterium]|nr:class I SAM-dependent methyltransferase [Candidatus Dadabacteria bacterium]
MGNFVEHVSDTSFWVAHYRAIESERSDSLFKDPYAAILVGDHAPEIEKMRSEVTKWTQWTVVMRTYIIDQMIRHLIEKGVTTFLNVGAGLDSRPYRMKIDPDIVWIEMDFPQVIEHKGKHLQRFSTCCKLESIGLDLSSRGLRRSELEKLASQYPNIAVLTEGVLPYLTEEQVSELSEDLVQYSSFKYWICEYISSKSYRYLKDPKRMKALKNAPFQFYPEDWMGFFQERGWNLVDSQYYTEVSEKFGRPTPMPKFFKILELIMGKKWAEPFKRMSGFLLWERK